MHTSICRYFNHLSNKMAFHSNNFCIWIESDATFKTPTEFIRPQHWSFLKFILLLLDTMKSADYISTLSHYLGSVF